ncbi:2215_t:CDS:2, partial [Ambispora gerdemannii]
MSPFQKYEKVKCLTLLITKGDTNNYKKAIITKIKDGESDNNDNRTLVINGNDESGNLEDTDNNSEKYENTTNVQDLSNVDGNDSNKKVIIAEIKDGESDNNNNRTLVIDGNDESDNLEDTDNNDEKYEDMRNRQDSSNVDNNNSIINHVNKNRELGKMITCIVPTNEGDYKKAIITEIKDNEKDTENDDEKYEDMTNRQDSSNIDDNDNIINCIDKNRELGGMITYIIFTNEDDYKKAIITEIKDNKSDNNNNRTLVINKNNKFFNIENTENNSKKYEDITNRQDLSNNSNYKKAIITKIKYGESDNNDNRILVINGNDESDNIEDTENDSEKELDRIVLTNEELDRIILTNEGNYKKAIVTEIKNNIGMYINKDDESDNNDNGKLTSTKLFIPGVNVPINEKLLENVLSSEELSQRFPFGKFEFTIKVPKQPLSLDGNDESQNTPDSFDSVADVNNEAFEDRELLESPSNNTSKTHIDPNANADDLSGERKPISCNGNYCYVGLS